MVNHVKVPYNGVANFKPDKSLCPKCYYGTKVDVTHYRDMANALYQLLALQDTVSREYTDICNTLH